MTLSKTNSGGVSWVYQGREDVPHPHAPEPDEGELETMRDAMGELVELLSYARPHGTESELVFLREFLIPRLRKLGQSVDVDGFGNLWTVVAAPSGYYGPAVLWSCHIDTVHNPKATRQGIAWADDGRTLKLAKRKPGRCLGADDGAGVWLLLQMIAARVPGSYVFHRGEEAGRLGSEFVSEKEPERLSGFDACIAFDRRDYRNLITHQMGERCASEAFASSFSAALNAAGRGLDYKADDTGSYTDSYSYARHISECANVSVGYDCEHGPRETLDALHLWRLAEAICAADLGRVECERDPSVIEYDYAGGYGRQTWPSGSRTGAAAWGADSWEDLEEGEALVDLIRRYPRAVADMLGLYGLGAEDLAEHMTDSELAGAVGSGLLVMPGSKKAAGGGWDHD